MIYQLYFLYQLITDFIDVTQESLCVGAARIGWPDQTIVAGTLAEMINVDLGSPLHSLVIVGNLHPLEEQFLKQFYIENK